MRAAGRGLTIPDQIRAAVLTLREALDPQHQGEGWPDPIAWDGRTLREQARDLLLLADAEDTPDGCTQREADIREAARRLRQAVAR